MKVNKPLTPKMKQALKNTIANGGNFTQGVADAYDVKRKNARVLAHQLRQNENLALVLNRIFGELDFDCSDAIQRLIGAIKDADIKNLDKYLKLYFEITGNKAEATSKQKMEISNKEVDEVEKDKIIAEIRKQYENRFQS